MATIRTFEDIVAWQKARTLVDMLFQHIEQGKLNKNFELRDQLQRASASIMSNIAEGFERNSTKEFIRFLTVAKGSAGEVRAQLCIARDRQYISQQEFEQLSALAIEIGKMLGALIIYLNNTSLKGLRYKKT